MSKLTRTTPVALLKVEEAQRLLASCRRIDEAKSIKDKAEAIKTYLRTQRASREAVNDAGEITIWATRRMGELLEEQKKGAGRRKPGQRSQPATAAIPTLADLGVRKDEAARAQQLAKLPEEKVRSFVEKKRAEPKGEITVSGLRKEVGGAVKAEAKQAKAEEIRREPKPVPEGQFRVLVLDPPWKYDSRAEDPTHRGRNQYPDMTVEEIAALPVAARAHEDCVLWLWTTNSFMEEACQLVRRWGFEKKTILTWDKVNLGVGDYLRNITEHCILAVRGHPVLQLTNQTTLITEKRREHSRKPEAFYALVESLCPGSKLEMFAREERAGWVAWGAETGKFSGAA